MALRGPFATANCQVGQCGGGSGGWRGRVERLALRDAHPSLRVHVSAGMSAELANRVAAGELAAAPAVFR
ncbi:hypothetical protein WS58_11470 [Burkholderia pseudomultivorans]|nr:hypothetical protein B1M_18937 [Burkholderia sp. TJI49]KVC46524.1 hypothetical protein WS58_11470 [Burkholderia pseudomultivorans]